MPSTHLSDRAVRLICDTAIHSRRAAFLRLDKDGGLIEYGGAIDHYPMPPLAGGSRPSEVVDFLSGMLPIGSGSGTLAAIQLADDVWVEAHLVAGDLDDWVILFDSTSETAVVQRLQQRLYEMRLGEEQRRRRDGRDGGDRHAPESGVEARSPAANDLIEEIAVVQAIVGDSGAFDAAGRNPARQLRLLAEVRATIREVAERHGARVLRSYGSCCVLVVGVGQTDPSALDRGCSLALELARGVSLTQRGDRPLSLRVAIGAGPVAVAGDGDLGGSRDVWGHCLEEADDLCRRAGAGEILAPLALGDRLARRYRGEARDDGWRLLAPLA